MGTSFKGQYIMINLFRKNRKKLMDENKFSKYLFYTFGEIALIVVGIMLALYLDQLNNKSKIKSDEIEILKEIKSNLMSSKITFQRTIDAENMFLDSNLKILDYLDNRKPYEQSLDRSFGIYYWTISTNVISGGYNYLKSTGIDIISNNKLRQKISYIFENKFAALRFENEVWSNNLQQIVSYPYHVAHFRSYYAKVEDGKGDKEIEHARPFNYSALLDDDQFKSINAEIIVNRRWNIFNVQELIDESDKLIIEIAKEIEHLSSE